MLNILRNKIYLFFWNKSSEKIDNGRIHVTHSYDNYGGTVYDINWKVSLYNAHGVLIGRHTIQERTDKRNLIKTIKRIEKEDLQQMLDKLRQSGKRTS